MLRMSFLTFPGILLVCGIFSAVTAADDAATSSIVSGVNCSSPDSLVQGMQQCLNTYNIPVTIPADHLDDISTFLTIFYQQLDSAKIKTLCKTENRENYILGTLCIISVSTKCSADNPVLGTLTPQALRQQVEFQCQSLSEYNLDCATAKIQEIMDCTNSSYLLDTRNLPDGEDTFEYIMCMSAVASRMCATQHLSECGASTLQIYMQQLPPYPAMCSNYTGEQASALNSTVDCGDLQKVGRAHLQCQVEAGVFILLPSSIQSHDDIVEFILNTITADVGPKVCSKLTEYERLVNCTLSIQAQCTVEGEKKTLPDIGDVQQGIRRTCQHVQDYNSTCITAALAALNKTEDKDTSSEQKLECDDHKAKMDALLSAVSSCDEKTVSLYRDTLSAQLPTECRPLIPSTFPSAGVNTGARTTLSVFSLTVVLLGAVISN